MKENSREIQSLKWTLPPLHLAASNNNHSFVTALFEADADPGARDIIKKTHWDYAQGNEALKTQVPKSNLRIFG